MFKQQGDLLCLNSAEIVKTGKLSADFSIQRDDRFTYQCHQKLKNDSKNRQIVVFYKMQYNPTLLATKKMRNAPSALQSLQKPPSFWPTPCLCLQRRHHQGGRPERFSWFTSCSSLFFHPFSVCVSNGCTTVAVKTLSPWVRSTTSLQRRRLCHGTAPASNKLVIS